MRSPPYFINTPKHSIFQCCIFFGFLGHFSRLFPYIEVLLRPNWDGAPGSSTYVITIVNKEN